LLTPSLFRPTHLHSHLRYKAADTFKNVLFLQSQYDGIYPGQEKMMQDFRDYLSRQGIRKVPLHSSGHAFEKDLRKFVEAVKPKLIIPIHTLHPEGYGGLFPDYEVKALQDGEIYDDPKSGQ